MIKRRHLLKSILALPFVGGLVNSRLAAGQPNERLIFARDYFKELGLRSYINAAGTYTSLTGCLMRPEVMDAIQYASQQYVRLEDIQDRAGARLAE
ncbi:MAG: selenocysteine synthase, partial [Cyclobacteriaceae bacterium]|nr:selenocysteine synthase [Cyclobacteriaceae bacterium]